MKFSFGTNIKRKYFVRFANGYYYYFYKTRPTISKRIERSAADYIKVYCSLFSGIIQLTHIMCSDVYCSVFFFDDGKREPTERNGESSIKMMIAIIKWWITKSVKMKNEKFDEILELCNRYNIIMSNCRWNAWCMGEWVHGANEQQQKNKEAFIKIGV